MKSLICGRPEEEASFSMHSGGGKKKKCVEAGLLEVEGELFSLFCEMRKSGPVIRCGSRGTSWFICCCVRLGSEILVRESQGRKLNLISVFEEMLNREPCEVSCGLIRGSKVEGKRRRSRGGKSRREFLKNLKKGNEWAYGSRACVFVVSESNHFLKHSIDVTQTLVTICWFF